MVSEETLQDILANSYKDFHAKGFDYICLKRTEEETLKVYFFDGDVSKLPEVVMPHDHRYGFLTSVLAGKSINRTFKESRYAWLGNTYEEFAYWTPLNGGDGFEWVGHRQLYLVDNNWYGKGDSYYSTSKDIHTIQIMSDQTVLVLRQGPDEMPIGEPTRAFRPAAKGKTPPNLDGLYSRFTPDEVLKRLEQIRELTKDM